MEITIAAWKISQKWQVQSSIGFFCYENGAEKKIEANTYISFLSLSFVFYQLSLNKHMPYSNASEGKVFTSKLKSHKS